MGTLSGIFMARTYSIRKRICFIRNFIVSRANFLTVSVVVMVSILISTAVDRVFEPRSGPTQTLIHALVCVASPLSTQY